MRIVRLLSLALLMLVMPALSFAGVLISVNIAPPALPVYEQPPCPADGYVWTPGYWAYGPEGYYWVPGTWVMPPTVGVLWTPGYWGWGNGVYVWHAGYWGPHIGFYGGVNYGFGYFGTGYEGGYWRNRHFYYNRTVNNVTVTNVHIYNKTVINNVTVNRVSYNGGHGGINAHPTREQEMWGHERHFEATSHQRDHERDAGHDRGFLASENHGRPAVAATSRPGEFHGSRVEPMGREEKHGGRPSQPGHELSREPHPSTVDYRPERSGPHDNGHGHENGNPHDNGHGHENGNPHGNGSPREGHSNQEHEHPRQ